MPKLFLLDGMALAYRAHFALITSPIFNSKGVNTSAVYGFTNTLLELMTKQEPTHMAVVFDTEAPTQRHVDFADYKAQRQSMPEELSAAIPQIKRMLEAFKVPVITLDGYEADDIIGTLAKKAETLGFDTFMVTPDKDFGQLVSPFISIYKPSRMGDGAEILGPQQVLDRWGIQRVEQVIDLLALMGDASDNIPGVPGIGEKTAQKLIAQFDTVENLLASTSQLKGKQKETLETNRDLALLSKKLTTIQLDVPVTIQPDALVRQPYDPAVLQAFFTEMEFNSLGRRLFGESFKAGRGTPATPSKSSPPANATGELDFSLESDPVSASAPAPALPEEPVIPSNLKTIADVPHHYAICTDRGSRAALISDLIASSAFCFDSETTGLDPRTARLLGLSFSNKAGQGAYVPFPTDRTETLAQLEEFRPLFANPSLRKIGHNLKFDLAILHAHGLDPAGPFFDTMLAHCLVEPDQRHGMDYLSEVYLGYSPVPITRLIGEDKKNPLPLENAPLEAVAEYAAEDADVTWQLAAILEPLLAEKNLQRVFHEVESPLIPVLTAMEAEGIHLNPQVLADFSVELQVQIDSLEKRIHELAGQAFNLNSPKQLGEILFDKLKLEEKAKKTKTGQYSTNEQTLQLLSKHEIVRSTLDYREATKLKSTYVDALPHSISPVTGRVHTSFGQAVTATGRLQSQDPNLQNIPIRTAQGKEIRKAFVPRGPDYRILSADYSQIELRVIAALSGDPGMLEAFELDQDIHSATAARVYGVPLDAVTGEMRRKAKMVNFGIIYGISAFGLAQRLDIPRSEAGDIIAQYFKQYPGVRTYMTQTIESARKSGYVETVTGRRRYLRDINSANQNIRGGAERNAINTPIQGSAADMIKLAMIAIDRELRVRNLKTRMLLQVHDELVFDLYVPEEKEVREFVASCMRNAMPSLKVPMQVEIGTGANWLEAH